MRTTLLAIGAFILFACPFLLLQSVAEHLAATRQRSAAPGHRLTPRATGDLLRPYGASLSDHGVAQRPSRGLW